MNTSQTLLKHLILAVIVVFSSLMAESNSPSDTNTPEFAPYRPISQNPRDDGLYVGFYYIGHNKSYDGVKPDIDKKSMHYEGVMFATAISAGYYTSFADKKLREWDDSQGVFGIDWARDLVNIKVPFYIHLTWEADTTGIVDEEDKSLCYTPIGIGCVFPYTPHIKNSKAYALASLDSEVAWEIESKKDIVFPIALTSDEKFYQVIIFPHFMRLKDFESVEESHSYLQDVRDKCTEMKEWKVTPQGDDGKCYGEPINAFVPKNAIKKLLPSHPLMRLDPQYADSPVFFTPPKSIHKIHLRELKEKEKGDKK